MIADGIYLVDLQYPISDENTKHETM